MALASVWSVEKQVPCALWSFVPPTIQTQAVATCTCWEPIFSSFMHAHAQAMNEYCGGEISTEVIVDQNLWTEIVDLRRKWKHVSCERGSMVELLTFVCTDLVRGPYWHFFIYLFIYLFIFLFFFLNLKLPIMSFSYFVIQF